MIYQKALDKLDEKLNKYLHADQHLNKQALSGFFYALAITPTTIEPPEWFADIFNGEMPTRLNDKQIMDIKKSVIAVIQSTNRLLLQGNLAFPLNFNNVDELDLTEVWNWSYGFLRGINLRLPFWTSGIIARETNQLHDVVKSSINIFTAFVAADVRFLDNIEILRQQIQAKGKTPDDDMVLALVLQTLPEAYECIRIFAEKMSTRLQQHQSNRTLVNEFILNWRLG